MKQKNILITGGVGFVGSHLTKHLFDKGIKNIIVFDKLDPDPKNNYGKYVSFFKGNLLLPQDIKNVFSKFGAFSTIYHLASAMPNKEVSDDVMYKTNVIGTRNLIAEAVANKVNSFVFTSSNVTYGIPRKLPVTEETDPVPLEPYGKSKLEAEEEIAKFKKSINIQIIRCPVITGKGRLGLQAILYEFISENKKVYMLGDGLNRYQFVDVDDVCSALEKASHIVGFDMYNIGADNVLSLKELYGGVISFAKSSSKLVSLPKKLSLIALSILDKLNISPLGVYQYTMIGRSIFADTKKIKNKLHWIPKKTNLDTFIENYKWYLDNKGKFTEIGSGDFSANRSLPKMGAFVLLKMIS